MDADVFISGAIDKGSRQGILSLSSLERSVYLISEAEVACDMGSGLDYPLRHYGRDGLDVCADAFESIQAIPIARALREIRYADEQLDEESAEAAQSLISSRTGYDYSSIQKWVESHFHESS